MNRRAIVVALVVSLAFSWVLWKRLQNSAGTGKSPGEISGPPKLELKVPVVMVTKRVAAQTKIEGRVLADSFKMGELAESAVPANAITSLASLSRKFSSISLLPGDVMTNERLLDENFIGNLARAVPAGKRAFTIAVDKVTSVGGFIRQGDFVDVIANVRPRNSPPLSKVVLQDILVLTAGPTFSVDNSIPSSTPAISAAKVEMVTLAVSPEELERLMFMESEPSVQFRLVLKNPSDTGKRIVTAGENEKTLLSAIVGDAPESEPPPSAALPESQPEPVTFVAPNQEPPQPPLVEIQYGSRRKEELAKYSGPSGRYHKLPGLASSKDRPVSGDADGAAQQPE